MMYPPKDEGREAATSKPSKEPVTDSGTNNNKPPKKSIRVLSALTRRSWNRFEAERQLHDHCLHTTVATIQQQYGITIARKFETVPGFQGNPTHVCRYWLTPDQRAKALKVLGVEL